MSVDFEQMRAGMQAAIPFNTHVGLEVTELAPGAATVRLPDDERLRNHVGSQHAAGLFAAAEAASGGAFVATFAERLAKVTPLASGAEISYLKLAKGPIDARASLAGAEELLAKLDGEGKAEFPVEVSLRDSEGTEVATATIQWHVRTKS